MTNKEWVIQRTMTTGPELKTLAIEFLEKDRDTPISVAEHKGKRVSLRINCRSHVDAIKLNDIFSLGLSSIDVVE